MKLENPEKFRDLYMSVTEEKKKMMILILQQLKFHLFCTTLCRNPLKWEGEKTVICEQIIEKNIDKLFMNYEILSVFPYRVMKC